jgi:hypothetical protein
MGRKYSGSTVKAMTGRTLPLTPRPRMRVEVKNPLDGKISLFNNSANASFKVLFLNFAFFEGLLYSME